MRVHLTLKSANAKTGPIPVSTTERDSCPATCGMRSGRGSAGGCGYHKESQAIADAVSNAGVRLFGSPARYGREPRPRSEPFHFGGTGSSAYAEIFETIAKARGFSGPFLWVSHGL